MYRQVYTCMKYNKINVGDHNSKTIMYGFAPDDPANLAEDERHSCAQMG